MTLLEHVARAICRDLDGDPDQQIITDILPTTRTGNYIFHGGCVAKNYVLYLKHAAAAIDAVKEWKEADRDE